MKNNLISIPQLVKNEYNVTFDNKNCQVSKNDKLLLSIPLNLHRNLYVIDQCCINVSDDLLHKRLGHLSNKNIDQLKKTIKCSNCQEANLKKRKFKERNYIKSKSVLNIIHSDICGPINIESMELKTKSFVTKQETNSYNFII